MVRRALRSAQKLSRRRYLVCQCPLQGCSDRCGGAAPHARGAAHARLERIASGAFALSVSLKTKCPLLQDYLLEALSQKKFYDPPEGTFEPWIESNDW